MNKIIFFLLALFLVGPTYSQSKVDKFYHTLTAILPYENLSIIDMRGKNLESDTLQTISANTSILQRIDRKNYKKIGGYIDNAKLIDYKSDTIYIISTYYNKDDIVQTTIKTKQGIFRVDKNNIKDVKIYTLNNYSTDIPANVKKLDCLLYNAIFDWNIDFLVDLIKSTGVGFGDNIYVNASRVILKENNIIKKDIIYFDPPLFWLSEDTNHRN